MKPNTVYITIKEFANVQKAYSYHALRQIRRNCKTNGFASAFKKVGKKVLIDVNEFHDCIERLNKEK